MNINFNGYNENIVTMLSDETLTDSDSGVVVTIKEDGTASKASSGDAILGVAVAVRDGYVSVQTTGFVKVSTETKIACGLKTLASNGKGGVAVNSSGRQIFVIESDDSHAGILL